MQATSDATDVALSQAGPMTGANGVLHFAPIVLATFVAAATSLFCVVASVTAPAAGRQLTDVASLPLDRLSSQAAIVACLVFT